MGPKWSKMGPKCPKWVQNGSKTGPKRGSKGGPKGGPKWVPQRSDPKKSRKIFVVWLQSTKKVTDVPVFEEKKLFLRNFFLRKKKPFALQGVGVVPQGGLQGGV